NGFDEALGLPTERAARLALRTQQIIACESGVTDTVDPLAGSYYVESLTEAVEAAAWQYLDKIDGLGGAVAAIEAGFQAGEIEQSAFECAQAIDEGRKVVVGVNRYVSEDVTVTEVLAPDPSLQAAQADRVRTLRARRDQGAVDAALADVAGAARGTQNLLVPMKVALQRRATLGEVSDVLRAVFGTYTAGG
ncbi:MAG: methylmalonyl-CoA mutase, N-terminal domain, partial [Acidimicrobiaceae bacterium]|nr:methylmalonyl-CoA mutase, N-terminal domain [Acidimicrobiaceae bacterium]